MPFLTLNGLALPVAVGSASGSLVETAATRATMRGKPRKERTSLLDEMGVSLWKLTNDEAAFLEVVVEGLFHRVPFDDDDNSTDGYLNTGTSSIIESPNAKTGIGYAELNTYSYAWPFAVRSSPNKYYSLMYWRSTSLPTWDHFIVSVNGATTEQYKNGVLEGTPTSLTELTVTATGEVQLSAASNIYVDELVVFHAPMTSTQASETYAWLNAGNAYPDPPEVIIEGTSVDNRKLRALAEVGGVDYEQGSLATGWANNIRRANITLTQSRHECDLRRTSPDVGIQLGSSYVILAPVPNGDNIVLDMNADNANGSGEPVDEGTYNVGALSTTTGTPTHLPTSGPSGGACWDLDEGDSYTHGSPASRSASAYTLAVVLSNYSADSFERSCLFISAAGTADYGGAFQAVEIRVAAATPYDVTNHYSTPRIASPHSQGDGNWTLWVEKDGPSGFSCATYDLGSVTATNTGSEGGAWSSTYWGDGIVLGKFTSTSSASTRIARVIAWDVEVSDLDTVAAYLRDYYGL